MPGNTSPRRHRRPGPSRPFTWRRGGAHRSRPEHTYRVEYHAGRDQGLMVLSTTVTDAGALASYAADELHDRGIDGQIRRIVRIGD